jgi:hypothetical protein
MFRNIILQEKSYFECEPSIHEKGTVGRSQNQISEEALFILTCFLPNSHANMQTMKELRGIIQDLLRLSKLYCRQVAATSLSCRQKTSKENSPARSFPFRWKWTDKIISYI